MQVQKTMLNNKKRCNRTLSMNLHNIRPDSKQLQPSKTQHRHHVKNKRRKEEVQSAAMTLAKPLLSIAASRVAASTPPLGKRHPEQFDDYCSMHSSFPSSLATTALSTAPPCTSPLLHAPTSYHK